MGTLVPLPASCSDPCAGSGLSIPGSVQAGTWVAWAEATACGMSLATWQGWDGVTQSESGPALTPCSPQAHEQDDAVEQEHVLAGMQELCSQQAEDPQKPSAQGESP